MNGLGGLTSGDVLLEDVRRQGWWLVEEADDGPGRAVAGPYPDRTEAAWAAAEDAALPAVRAEYGVRRANGSLSRRATPEERAWFTQLEQQLDRLPDDWDTGLGDDHPLATLVVEIVAAFTDAGLPLHDARATSPAGGVSIVPEPLLGGAVVTWRQHDRASVDQVCGADVETKVAQVLGRAVAEVLEVRAFSVEEFGGSTGVLVRWGA